MYINKMNYFNMGPIDCAKIEAHFYDNGNPKPIIIVGENGSGKSLLVSNIVDALFCLRKNLLII